MHTTSTADTRIKLTNVVARAPRVATLQEELEFLASDLPESGSRIMAASALALHPYRDEAAYALSALRMGDEAPEIFAGLVNGWIELSEEEADFAAAALEHGEDAPAIFDALMDGWIELLAEVA